MKKLILILAALLLLVGCKITITDNTSVTTSKDERPVIAIIRMPDDSVNTVQVSNWYIEKGEQLTIVSTDGTVYRVSSVNCVMIKGGTQ